MKNKSKKMMLFSLVVMLGFSFVSLIVAFSIKNIPENISYAVSYTHLTLPTNSLV